MKEIKYLRLFAALVLLFVLYNNLGADEQKPAQPLNNKEKQLIQFTPAKTKVKQANPKQAAEEKAREEEQKRLEAEAGLKEKQQELALKEMQLKAKREQERKAMEAELRAQKQKETQKKQLKLEAERKTKEEEKARAETERKAREEELARQKEERLKQEAKLKARREQERKTKEEEKARAETERRAREEGFARQKEKLLKQEAKLKARREQERKAKEEEERMRAETERKAHEEGFARQREELLKQEAKLKARREQERKAKEEEERMRAETERKAREEELVWQREERSKELAREREERLEELARHREERLRQQRELEARREQERKAKEEEEERVRAETELRAREEGLAKQREKKQKQLAGERARQEQEHWAREEELVRQIQERFRQQQELEAKQEQERQAREGKLARQREEANAKINEFKKASSQEKIFTEAMLKKQQDDQAKIEKIEKLWKRAKKLYDQEKYEEAIQDFQKIIDLEGNPRIKYTPYAKEYIYKAKTNILQKKGAALSDKVELSEKEMINEVLKQQVPPYIEPPKRIEQREPTLLVEPPAIRKELKATKITIDFDKVGLKSVISFLSQESGINFVVSQKVLELALAVSAKFKEASLDEVIKYITKSLGLVYRIDKEIVWVAHPEEIANEPMETRVYYLNRGGGLFTEFSPMSSGTTETSLGGSSAQINKIFTIEDTLKEVVSWPADAKITYDKRINALIVRNTPQNLQMLEDILYSMDVEPLQVLIEARFLEVDITDIKEGGLDWNLTGGDLQLKQSKTGAFKKGIGTGSGVDFTAFTRAAEGLNLTYKGMLTNSQFQAVLHALEETKKIKTLSSPRITTLNNQMATIKVVDEWIYPTRYEYEIVQFDLNGDGDFSDAGETTFKNVPKDFLRRDVGILLKVIPSVGADKKTISLSLIPEVSEGTADGFTYTGDVKLPKFTSRNLSTTVVVNSGETVVLGGMIKESRTKTNTKIPVLGNIPILGAFFRKNTDSIERKNLLIFVTAKVLSASGEEVIIAQK